MPEVAFSSLTASPVFLATAQAQRFSRAYRQARAWVRQAPAAEVARTQGGFFPGVAPEALQAAIARYQTLGCWNGDIAISPDLYEQALEVFLTEGAIRRRHPYQEVVAPPPDAH